MNLKTNKKRIRLYNCPIGLFMFNGEMCLKTEYYTKERCDCFIVSSGEYFCGGVTELNDFMNLLVFPIKINTDNNKTINTDKKNINTEKEIDLKNYEPEKWFNYNVDCKEQYISIYNLKMKL